MPVFIEVAVKVVPLLSDPTTDPLVEALERIFIASVVFIFLLIVVPELLLSEPVLPDPLLLFEESVETLVKYAPLTQPLPEILYHVVLPLTLVPVLVAVAVNVVLAANEPVIEALVEASERIFMDDVVFIC